MQLGWLQSITSADLEKIGHLQSNVIYYQTDLNRFFFKNDDSTTEVVKFVCRPLQLPPLHGCTP